MDFLLLSVVFGSSFGLTSGFLFRNTNSTVTNHTLIATTVSPPQNEHFDPVKAEAGTNHTLRVTTLSPLQNEDFDPVKAEAGAIAGVVFGVLISAVFVAIAGFMYIRRKRVRDREYMRRSNIHRMSKQSAGVYTDTTVDTNFRRSEAKTEGYRALQKDPNMYEDDSEDEL